MALDVAELSDLELAQLQRCCSDEQGRRALARRGELTPSGLWPVPVFEAALEVCGPSVYGEGRVRGALDKRIRHALTVWDDRFGPFEPAQQEYAEKVLAAAIRRAAKDAGDEVVYPFLYSGLDRVVHLERVHDGFKNRSGEAREIDTSAQFRDAA